MSETIEGDAATQTAVEGPANITGDQLTSMLTPSSQGEPEVEDKPKQENSQVQEEVTESVEGQPEASEGTKEEVQSDEENVLSKDGKAIDRMQSRIDKVTAEKYELMDRLNKIESQMRENTEAKENAGKKLIDVVSEAKSFDDLVKYEQEARDAKRFALQNVGKDEVEYQGNVYSDEQIRQILLNAEDVLEKIPEKRQILQTQDQYDKNAKEIWPEFEDSESELSKWYNEVMSDPAVDKAFSDLPNKRYVMGLIKEGELSLLSRQKNAEENPVKEEDKAPEPEPEKPAPVQQTPTPVPGLTASAPPPAKSGSDSIAEARKKLTSSNMSSESLTSLLDAQYKQKS